jgi:cytochrome c553
MARPARIADRIEEAGVRRVFQFAARHPVMALLVAATVGLLAVSAVVISGVIPITASSGHWAATEWFLHFTMRRSVVTHSLLAPAPPRDFPSPAMVLRGAGHFETGCRSCHGAPGDRLPPIPQAMTPHPPRLGPRMASWDAAELFYIVKHGVKFTGMPAWPALDRDDEVWAMVAFLQRLPQLAADDYEALVWGGVSPHPTRSDRESGSTSPPAVVVESCARCHGVGGEGRGEGAFPKLAGQRLEYMTRAMHAYADGRRLSGMMRPIAARLTDGERHDALRYYASLPIAAAGGEAAAGDRGAVIAREGVPAQEIPACVECHAREPINPAYPRLHGQDREYLVQQLRLLQQRRRGGSEFVQIMHTFVDRLSADQIDAVAAHFAGVRP